jgi:NitT/TauT family transport system substrate-binding protein
MAGRKRFATCVYALLALFLVPRPALADDSLNLVAGSAPGVAADAIEFVAQGAGFYRAEHLTVNKQYASNGSIAAQLVASGHGDVVAMSVEPLFQGYEKGLRLQIFLSRQSTYSYVMAVLDGSPIKTLEDFKGTEIGELSLGGASEVSAASMLAGVGLKRSDYSIIPIGADAQGLDAIITKKVAGVTFPYVALVQYEISANVKFRLFQHPLLKDISNVGYAAAPATIQAKADVLKRFARALVKGALFIRENPEAAARLYFQVSGAKFSETDVRGLTRYFELIQNTLPAADPTNPRIGYMSPQGVELYSELLAQSGTMPQVVPASAIVTDRFIPFANDFDHKAVIALAKKMH